MSDLPADYTLEDQIGFVLRLAAQRHAAIFQDMAPRDLTPTQFSALVRLAQAGPCSQNELGRRTAMDVATVKGVVDRLKRKGLVTSVPDPHDKRRSTLSIALGHDGLLDELAEAGRRITAATLEPLDSDETDHLLRLLKKISGD